MNFEEHAIVFPCKDCWLYGVLAMPDPGFSKGVLIVVGGPQYRVGSHRQFTLLARHLASQGVPVMRFDSRGMGDSEGSMRTFEDIEDDFRCAIEKFFEEVPAMTSIVIWGLCDAASAALFYAYRDRRITGLVLLNPWIRTDQGAARTYLKHYYLARAFEPEFWHKVRGGHVGFPALRSFFDVIGEAVTGRKKAAETAIGGPDQRACDLVAPLPERMLYGLRRFSGHLLLIMSGNDLTAQEFSDTVKDSSEWQKLLSAPRVSRFDLPDANHTFSRSQWRDQVAAWTNDWIRSW